MPFNNPIAGGLDLIREALQSPNYVPGSAGWSINQDGFAEFNGVVFRGTLNSVSVDGLHSIDIAAGEIQIDQQYVNGSITGLVASTTDLSGNYLSITSQTGMLLQSQDILTLQSASEVDIQSDTGINGLFVATSQIFGRVSITPVANTPTSTHVSYTLPPSVTNVYGFATAQTSVPGTAVTGVGITNVTTTGADIFLTRTNTTSTNVYYAIIGGP